MCGFKFELVDIDGARTTENSGLLIATEVNSGLVSEKVSETHRFYKIVINYGNFSHSNLGDQSNCESSAVSIL